MTGDGYGEPTVHRVTVTIDDQVTPWALRIEGDVSAAIATACIAAAMADPSAWRTAVWQALWVLWMLVAVGKHWRAARISRRNRELTRATWEADQEVDS